MLRLIKWLVITLVLLVVVGLPAVFVGINYVNFEDYQNEVAEFISKQTGYPINLSGPLQVKTLPQPKLVVGHVEVGAFTGNEPLFTADDIQVVLSYKDLSRLGLAVELFSMENPQVYLSKNAEGQANYLPKRASRNLGGSGGSADAPNLGPLRSVEEVRITNGQLVYEDAQAGISQTVKNFNLTIGGSNLAATEVAMSADVNNMALNLQGTANLSSLSSVPTDITLKVDGNTLKMNGTLGDIFSSPRYYGDVVLDAPNAFNTVYKATSMPRQQQQFAFPVYVEGQVTVSDENFAFEEFTAKLGAAQLGGDVNYNMGKNSELNADLKVANLNLNTLNVCGKENGSSGSSGTAAGGNTSSSGAQPATPWSTELMDFSFLRNTNMNVVVSTGSIVCDHRTIDSVELRMKANRGVLTLEDLNVQAGGGTLRVTGRLDAADPARVSMDVNSSKLPISLLLPPSVNKYLQMSTNAIGSFRFQGNSQQQWAETLTGNLEVSADEGSIRGVSLQNLVNVVNLFTRKEGENMTQRSPIDELQAKMTIENGVITMGENVLESGDVKITGAGKIDVGHWTINYRLVPTLRGKFGVIVPVHVRGSLYNPTVTPEVINKQNIGAAVGAVLGGPAGAAAGALLGNTMSEDTTGQQGNEGSILPFDLNDANNLKENLRDFLNGK